METVAKAKLSGAFAWQPGLLSVVINGKVIFFLPLFFLLPPMNDAFAWQPGLLSVVINGINGNVLFFPSFFFLFPVISYE